MCIYLAILQPKYFYNLADGERRYSVKFQTATMVHHINFKNLATLPPHQHGMRVADIFDDIIHKVSRNMAQDDKVRFHMKSPGWKRDLNMPFMESSELTGARVLVEFTKTAQSNDNTKIG